MNTNEHNNSAPAWTARDDASRALVVDCQVLQGPAFRRGLGRYTLSLIRALPSRSRFCRYSSYHLLLSRASGVADELRQALSALTGAQVDLADLQPAQGDYARAAEQNRAMINRYVADLSMPVDFLIPALFHPAAPVFPSECLRLLVFYDLIPLLFHREFLPWKSPEMEDYVSRLGTLLEADFILSDSDSAADDLITFLGINIAHVKTIGGAAVQAGSSQNVRPQRDTGTPFVLFPSGDNLRKNNAMAIRAFERVRRSSSGPLRLLVTSEFQSGVRAELQRISPAVEFVGHVSDEELSTLYGECQVVLFPSLYEGLGLPLLEAVQHERPVVCSDLPVFREISESAFYWCDPCDEASVASGLLSALSLEDWGKKREDYKRIRHQFTWENTADALLDALPSQKTPERTALRLQMTPMPPRVAMCGPTPEGYSAIGKRIAELHPALARHFDITYFLEVPKDHQRLRPSVLPPGRQKTSRELGGWNYPDFDAVFYHVGNSTYHLDTARLALHLPGYVILHDTWLQGLWTELATAGLIADARLELERRLEKSLGVSGACFVASILSRQLGVVVHSGWAERVAEQVCPAGMPITRLELPVPAPPRGATPRRPRKPCIAAAGILGEPKGLDILARLARESAPGEFSVAAFGFQFQPHDELGAFLLHNGVAVYANLTDFEFQQRLQQVDVLMNFRSEYHGEASGSVLEAMRYGIACVVRDIGWYAELPHDVVVKVATPEEAVQAARCLAEDPERRRAIGGNARRYVTAKHNATAYAEGLLTLLEQRPSPLGARLKRMLLKRPRETGVGDLAREVLCSSDIESNGSRQAR